MNVDNSPKKQKKCGIKQCYKKALREGSILKFHSSELGRGDSN